MKAVYDKILFLIALLILAGSAVYFFAFSHEDSAVRNRDPLLSQAPGGKAYAPIAAPVFERKEVPWPAPQPQSEDGNWLFDVFTPPRIYWDPVAKKLVPEPWQPPEQAPPFALELVSIEQELFRIQLEAYFAANSGKPEETTVQFYDNEKQSSFRGTAGTTFKEHELSLDAFKTEREFNPDGSVITVATAEVTDLRSGEKLTLSASKKLYLPGKFEITLRTTAPLPAETFVWKSAGEKHAAGDATFTLDSFDLDAKTVTVTKVSPKLDAPATETLTISAPAPEKPAEAPQPEPKETNEPAAAGSFENLFR